MAIIVRWSDRALDHLESIRQFIAIDSERYAALLVKQVFESAAILSDFPEIGTIIHETAELNLRERWIGKYRLVYRLSPELVEIVTIRHGARLFGLE